MKRILPFLAAVFATSLATPTRAQTGVEAPAGWKMQTKSGGARTFTPPHLQRGEVFSLTTYDWVPLRNQTPEAFLQGFAGPVGTRAGQLAAPLRIQVKETAVSGSGAYCGPNGAKLGVFFLAFTHEGGRSIAVSRTLYSRGALLSRYKDQTIEINQKLVASTGRSSASANAPRGANAPSTFPATGPMRPANLGGAKVFVKYYWTSYPSLKLNIGHLLLFPDGTAFDGLPSKPLSVWSAAEIRKSVPRFDLGKWKMAGNKMTLTFGQRKRDSVRTLTRNPRGWNDPSEMAMNGDNYNIYFPVAPPPRARLLGAWSNENLVTAGTAGGAAPMVAGGSSSALTLGADGTFAGNSRSFFSATTSNLGEAYKSGGNVFTSGQGRRQSAGKWRLDGPLLTMEKGGERTIHLAFLLPYWSKTAVDTDLMIDDDRWTPAKK